ncbi:hypothetical protein CBR_g22023 [Chara braunii]|uniref:Reverse transcriptase domain-containing protein n=1 Tax=Chara braunii TaxID=69332 RepID=A0A388L1T8_CHABU|nr:hypothetical protein CBR_g22023 [Chara braunii]|eukprot:GBG76275.1 hypothetical protein CBR_g22023 [Chara braunii]
MRDARQSSRTPMKQRRINLEGAGEVTCEAEEENLEFAILPRVQSLGPHATTLANHGVQLLPDRITLQSSTSRIASSAVQLGEQQWTIMTVYAPSDPVERRGFLEELPHVVPPAQNIVLAGDFNLVLQPGLDSPAPTPRKLDAQMLLRFMELNEFTDAYRSTHPTVHGYTWHSSQRTGDAPPPKRRLDLLLTKGAAWESLTTAEVMITPGSDHRPVVADFLLEGQLQRGPGIFRLNIDHLNSPELLQWVANHWQHWQSTRDWFDTEEEWTAVGFRIVTRALDVFSCIQARGRRQQEDECLAHVKEAEDMLETGTITELYWLHRRDRWLSKWDDLQIEQQISWANKAKEKGSITADRMSKETFQRIYPRQTHTMIRELQHPFHAEADVATDSEAIGDYARQYFEDILTSRRPPDQSLGQLREENDLWSNTTTQLSSEARDLLEQPITMPELWAATKAMAKGKSPGSDGLPVEFYIASWEHVGPILLRLFNRIVEGGTLTEDMKFGVITLLYKKGDKRNVRNWRPISRLNVSYKILAKVLARRLAPFLPNLVHTDQGAFVQGSSIFENVLAAMGALEIIQREDRQVMVAMLDLEKAYDRVNWSLVLATLQHMNFGPKYYRWVSELYTDSTAAVLVNGFVSPIFTLTRSLRQGCPLASLLFAIQMETLLNSLRAAPQLQGLQGDQLLTGAIADDLLLVTEATPDSLVAPKSILDSYSQLSEAQPLQQAPGPMQPMQWMPKIPLLSPKPFSGDRKKDEDLDTWVRTVPTYVRHKLTRPEQKVVVVASFLEGSAARWLNGFVQQQGYGQNFDAWAQAQTLEQFVQTVYKRWHDPQGAQKATGAINNLCAKKYKNVREVTDTVERLIVVPGVRFDAQVLLTDYLRCLPSEVRTKLVDEAYRDQHSFATFSRKALDIEAKLGSAHQVSHYGRKRLPQDWKKKGQLMFVDHDGQTTEIDDFLDLGEVTEQDGASETSDGGVVAPIKEKARGIGKKKVVRSTGVVEREVVHAIEVVPGSKVPRGRIYRMSSVELDELRRQLKELTEKGWIRPSTSPYGAPVLFVPKKGGTLRMCIDYRGLNAITVKNAEPLPRINDRLDRVQGCRYSTKIALKSGYHQIAIRPEDQHKTAFQTRYGLYEFVVMPFGLCNAPGTFQHAMNRIFHDYLDTFIVVYLDDILIFSKTAEEHAEHLNTVLGLLRQHQYKINLEKCEFGRTKILHLGHEISADGLRPEDAKVASIRDWPRP